MSDVKAKVLKPFKDHGTDQRFEAGKTYSFSPATLANYEAADLVEALTKKAEPDNPSK